MAQSTATALKTDNKYIFVTTERERQDAGVFLDEMYFISNAKSMSHVNKYKNKFRKYSDLIRSENKNWIDLIVRSRGKYRYEVMADCLMGFRHSHEFRFTPAASAKIKQHLQSFKHKTDCVFDSEKGNCVLYAYLTTWEDAVNFATFISNLDLSNYCPYSDAFK